MSLWLVVLSTLLSLSTTGFGRCLWSELEQSAQENGSPLTLTYVDHLTIEDMADEVPAILGTAQNGVHRYLMTYQSENIDGEATPASGLLLIPDTCKPSYPVISFQHGTLIHNEEIPSIKMKAGLAEAGKGYLVIAQDYLGFGASKDLLHPYSIPLGYQNSGLHMLKALKTMSVANEVELNPLFLKGYSEGGFASLAMQKAIEGGQLPDYDLRGVSAAGSYYDLVTTGAALIAMEGADLGYLGNFITAYSHYYRDGQMDRYIQKKFRDLDFFDLYNGDYTYNEVRDVLPSSPQELMPLWYRTQYLAKAYLISNHWKIDLILDKVEKNIKANSLHKGWSPRTPTRIYHCQDDDIVPALASDIAYDSLKELSDAVELIKIESPGGGVVFKHSTCPAKHTPVLFFDKLL